MTRVVNIRHASYDVYIGRAGKGQSGYFGNPHPVGFCTRCGVTHGRGEALEAYRKDFLRAVETNLDFRARLLALRGKTLGCFCKPNACHGDVIAEWVDTHSE